MNCSSIDLKAYWLGECSSGERREVEQHVSGCAGCGRELERLELTQAALLALREEEPPRRIAFISDKVFAPRWYQQLWQSGPRLGFASAMMLACAILVHAFYVPPPAAQQRAGLDTAQVQAMVDAEVSRRLDAAVQQAVAVTVQGQEKKVEAMVAATAQRLTMEHREDLLAVQESFEVLRKRTNVIHTASADFAGQRQ
ncbi:MAG: zf-HC2 domain-containing protein [Acidobacteriia bacterium]|nr:zf-HC2 domain-containing protein [Terriglobia bacterium]